MIEAGRYSLCTVNKWCIVGEPIDSNILNNIRSKVFKKRIASVMSNQLVNVMFLFCMLLVLNIFKRGTEIGPLIMACGCLPE